MNTNVELLKTLAASKIYKKYSAAWKMTTGMTLSFIPADAWNYPTASDRRHPSFYSFIATSQKICSIYLQARAELLKRAIKQAYTQRCPFGFFQTAVPVLLGDDVMGFLITGDVLIQTPSEKQFHQTYNRLGKNQMPFTTIN